MSLHLKKYINNQLMLSFFRSLPRTVPSTIFSNSNNYLLKPEFRQIALEKSAEPNIEYLHSLRALQSTISYLEANASNQAYQGLVRNELEVLYFSRENYAQSIVRYIARNGPLTAQAIANVYFAADKLKLTPEWLEENIHSSIPVKLSYMSRQNLIDLISGLQKNHKESPHLAAAKARLAQLPESEPVYVDYRHNKASEYEFADGNKSNNVLVSGIASKQPAWIVNACIAWSRVANNGKYLLHSD